MVCYLKCFSETFKFNYLPFVISVIQSGQKSYVFTGMLNFWVHDDPGPVYEPYGELSVDIGDKLSGIQLWKSPSSLKVKNNEIYKVDFNYKFDESSEFIENGYFVLLGKVEESDSGPNEILGDFDGEIITAKSIFNNGIITKKYPGSKGVGNAYVEIKMKLEEDLRP